ncbi:MAG TPA: hypothetical protein VM143_06750 [Acidimicrobiales bacterium]|nr:hypothetical protein [Acidimicrobiales bacterium]
METENQVPKGGDTQSLAGKVKEVAGWATGDRDVEAAGRADGEDDASSVEEVAEDVRVEHGDKGVISAV